MELVLSVFNGSTIKPCTYDFPVKSKADFLGLGNLITSIGFGAAIHLGIDLALSDPALVAVVGQTVTVEARHDAFFRLTAGLTPSPSPYDTAIPGVWAFNWFNQYADSKIPRSLPWDGATFMCHRRRLTYVRVLSIPPCQSIPALSHLAR